MSSPYRVLLKDSDGDHRLFAASIHKCKLTGRRNVHIIERMILINDATEKQLQDIAYSQVTKKNSIICERYPIAKDPMGLKYMIYMSVVGGVMPLNTSLHTQQSCLLLAMEHYMSSYGLTLIKQL